MPLHRPLAARMRPVQLEGVVGQDHLLGEGSLLPRLVRDNRFGSLLLYGPPGCGKTTLAEVIAHETGSRMIRVNAVSSNVAELRQHLASARSDREGKTVLFIDELHRFNKAQQDLLLPDVEEGWVRLIGATTYNPGFYVIPALLSRSHLFRLQPVGPKEVERVLRLALEEDPQLQAARVEIEDEVLSGLSRIADGDLRRGLNSLETLILGQPVGSTAGLPELERFLNERQIRYDAGEDEHYDTISAFIKSMRGGDPDAALYWLAKMLVGGEDPRFIARRLVIQASEDVGLADSRALPLAMAAYQACEVIGLPECELNLAHATVFLATAPKSNSACMGIAAAKQEIRRKGLQSVPLWLRDSHTKVSKEMGHGEGYRYSHNYPEAVSGQEFMIEPKKFYAPGVDGAEKAINDRLRRWKSLKSQRKSDFGESG
ncbi:replication-associated recombination protein A [Puniceicoccus vermicola]|uniref:replication-associated recombination protein A n=1 Tax=Puniceicoccus vermicola TaxID=388746 RepID=UPI001C8BC5F0